MVRRRIADALLASPASDPQRELVYFWETYNFRAQFVGSSMSRQQARKMAKSMARWAGVPVPRLYWVRRGKYTAWQNDKGLTVNLKRARWTPMLLAHEMAHWIVVSHDGRGQDHGPAWLNIYMQLLDKFQIVPTESTTPVARLFKLKFKSVAEYERTRKSPRGAGRACFRLPKATRRA